MQQPRRVNDSVHWFMNELTSRIVAESGIPSDRHHLGKIILQSLKDNQDAVLQIDGATGETETNASVLKRTVQCANGMKDLGLHRGDVMVLMAPNHIHLTIPYYAAMYLGIAIAPVDMKLTVGEIKHIYNIEKPKIVFCQSEKVKDIKLALRELKQEATIITFDKGEGHLSFTEFLENHGNSTTVEQFRPVDFDPEETISILLTTSGTTGLPKAVMHTHKSICISGPYLWSRQTEFPSPTNISWVVAPLQWISAIVHFNVSPIMKYTRLQSSKPLTQQHAYDLINTYRPADAVVSPTLMTTLLKPGYRDKCDFTCFDLLLLAGSALPQNLIEEIQKVTPRTEIVNVYGTTEAGILVFQHDYGPRASCGQLIPCFQARITNFETNEDITVPNMPGELWLKSPVLFKEYYKNPEETKQVFTKDGWFKTGDLFYRDDSWNYFFVDRIKSLLKYKSYQISPVEVETVIRQHPDILDVAVTGIQDPECGDLPIACVIPRPGCSVTAQEIKDIVKGSLSDSKQLRGGVIFLTELPITSTTKVDRRKLKEMVKEINRE